MTLSREELARRVKAAREALGLEQSELQKRVQEKERFGKTDIGRMERPNGKAPPPMSRMRAEALSRHTGFPPEWFTEPDLRKLFGSGPDEDRLARIEANLDARDEAAASLAKALSSVTAKVEETQRDQGDLLKRLERLERRREDQGS